MLYKFSYQCEYQYEYQYEFVFHQNKQTKHCNSKQYMSRHRMSMPHKMGYKSLGLVVE